MPATISVQEAQSRLKELIDELAPGEEVVVTENEQRVAKLEGVRPTAATRPTPGLGKGGIHLTAPDFDELPEEFQEYMA
jgi:antitoxin (DNA-binding transcriptional repressor) of toxin-antitoxin stability system